MVNNKLPNFLPHIVHDVFLKYNIEGNFPSLCHMRPFVLPPTAYNNNMWTRKRMNGSFEVSSPNHQPQSFLYSSAPGTGTTSGT